MPQSGVIRTVTRRWMILLPVLLLAGTALHGAVRAALAYYVSHALEEQAAVIGVELSYDSLQVGFTGLEIQGLAVKDRRFGSVRVERMNASVDLHRLMGGDRPFSEVVLTSPRITVARSIFENQCHRWNLCGKIPQSISDRAPDPDEDLTEAETLARSRLFDSFSNGTAANLGLFQLSERWEVRDLSFSVESSPLVAIQGTALSAFWNDGQLIVMANGILTSPHAEPTAFKLAAKASPGGPAELALALEDPLEISTPVAHLALGGIGVRSDTRTTVWFENIILTPILLDVASPWGADRVEVVIPHQDVPPVVEMAGVRGEIDLRSLSELADWLAEGPDPELETTPELVVLKRTLLQGLSDVRTALYEADLTLEVSSGDIQLHYDDGSIFALHSARMVVGAERGDVASLRLQYEGGAQAGDRSIPEPSGQVAVRLSRLTAAQIAEWSRH